MRTHTALLTLLQVGWLSRPISATPYQNRVDEQGTVFPAPSEYGTWLMAWFANSDNADLVYIQTSNTGSNAVQVQVAPAYDGYYSVDYRANTAFALENYGVWQLADYNKDGTLDLIYIQNRNTQSGKVEISVASRSSNYATLILQKKATVFDEQINDQWQVIDYDGDGSLDLVYIKNSNTVANKVEIHVASGASGFTTLTKQISTSLDISNDGTYQIVDYTNHGNTDLAFIQNINTASNYVEVNILSGSSNYETVVQSVPTTFFVENNGTWQMIDWDQDGLLDLVYIKEQNTAGSVEVHVASGYDYDQDY